MTPKTAENFVGLCTGDYGYSKITKKRLHYLGTKIHQISEGMFIKGGDITQGDGSGGESIYGGTFGDENFERKHSVAGLLSMAGKGRNANSSQFYVTLAPCPQFDGKHVVFGKVSEGMDVVWKIAKVPTNENDRPRIPVTIFNCGMLNDKRSHIRQDKFLETLTNFRNDTDENKKENELKKVEGKDISEVIKEIEKNNEISEESEQGSESENEAEGLEVPPPEENDNPVSKKLFELKLKLNEARKKNAKAVSEENERLQDPQYEKRRRAKEWEEQQSQHKEIMQEKGIDDEKWYMNEPLLKSKSRQFKQDKKSGKKKIVYGWDVFNQDSLYKAYNKRTKELGVDQEAYKKQMENNEDEKIPEDKLQRLVDDIEKQYFYHNQSLKIDKQNVRNLVEKD